MRTIKFRAKTQLLDEWVEGCLVKSMCDSMHYFIECADGLSHLVKPETVSQFIGFVDNRNNDIYENDIIEMMNTSPRRLGPVLWDECLASYVWYDQVHRQTYPISQMMCRACFKIGNRYDMEAC